MVRRRIDTRKSLLFVGALLLSAGCSDDAATRNADADPGSAEQPAATAVQIVDSAIAPAVAGQDGWNYEQSAEADLNGDGRAERIVLTARVEKYRGRFAWDDGHPWQLYIEDQDGARTYVYSRRIQLGTLAMRITNGTQDSTPSIVLIEHTPDQLNVYEAFYEASERSSTVLQFQRDLDPRGDLASPRLPN